MKLQFKFLAILSVVAGAALADNIQYQTYTWNSLPTPEVSDTVSSPNGAVVELERRIIEVYSNSKDQFEDFFVYHKKVKVNTTDALSANNKIFISLDDVISIEAIKARFIAPNGSITEVPDKSIKEIENLDNKGNYKTFAIEGATVGGEIEYFYCLKKEFSGFRTLYVQSETTKQNEEILLVYPDKLEFEARSYNGFAPFEEVTDTTGITTKSARQLYIPAQTDEQYAFNDANKMRVEIAMTYNNYNSTLRAYSWSKIAKITYSNYYELSKEDKKAAEKYLNTIKLKGLKPEEAIRAIENKVKTEIAFSEEKNSPDNLADIFKLKHVKKNKMAFVLVALFNAANIPLELVYTSDKTEKPFDPSFNCYNFLDELLLYFPEVNKVIAPTYKNYRLGITPSEYVGEYGLFMHPLEYNKDLKSMAYDIKKLPCETARDNTDTMKIDLTVNAENKEIRIKTVLNFSGHSAQLLQSFWELRSKEDQEKLLNTIFAINGEELTMNSYTVENGKQNDIGSKPIIITKDQTAHTLVEQAGEDLIIRIGETIARQSELYQEAPRKQPIQIDVLRDYYRKIIFHIPDGYSLNDPKNLIMNVVMDYNGTTGCYFSSDYQIEGNNLIVICKEHYYDDYYPVEAYESFRKVINAAADFNKIKIVLTKN